MGLPQTMCLHGYILKQATNYHVTISTIEDNKRIAHIQCDHELSGTEMIYTICFIDKMRNT